MTAINNECDIEGYNHLWCSRWLPLVFLWHQSWFKADITPVPIFALPKPLEWSMSWTDLLYIRGHWQHVHTIIYYEWWITMNDDLQANFLVIWLNIKIYLNIQTNYKKTGFTLIRIDQEWILQISTAISDHWHWNYGKKIKNKKKYVGQHNAGRFLWYNIIIPYHSLQLILAIAYRFSTVVLAFSSFLRMGGPLVASTKLVVSV